MKITDIWKGKLKRLILIFLSNRLKGWQIRQIKNLDLKLTLNLDSYIDYLVAVQGHYDKESLEKICSLLSKQNFSNNGEVVFFDIGSNIGIMSLYVSRRMPDVYVHAFEPISENYYQNKMNQIINNLSYPLHRIILGVKNQKEVEIYYSSAPLKQEFGKLNMGTASIYTGGNRNRDKFELCKMMTFDTFWIEHIDSYFQENIRKCVIKIDVEGAELDVISGMKEFLSSNRKTEVVLVVELLFDSIRDRCEKVIDLMESLGYELHNYSDKKIEDHKNLSSGNYIFFKTGHPDV